MNAKQNDYKKPHILITGCNGQVGWELQRSLSCVGKVRAFSRKEINITNTGQLEDVLESVRPDVIVNAAAYTAVDKAESDIDRAMQANVLAPSVMARYAKKSGSLLIHYSTDYVFNGEKQTAYLETDKTSPINVYGESKLKGEQEVEASGADYLILRTSWVYTSRGHNFLLSMLRLASEREELRIVSDQIGAPTSARLIADVTAHVIKQSMHERNENVFNSDIYHLVASGETSWHGFATEVIEKAKALLPERSLITRNIIPIATMDYPTPAKRPMNSRLSNEKIEKHFNLNMPDWSEHVEYCLKELIKT